MSELTASRWVSDGDGTDSSRPLKVHASRECIEGRQDPHTGLPMIARPATKEEVEKVPWCGTCWG